MNVHVPVRIHCVCLEGMFVEACVMCKMLFPVCLVVLQFGLAVKYVIYSSSNTCPFMVWW